MSEGTLNPAETPESADLPEAPVEAAEAPAPAPEPVFGTPEPSSGEFLGVGRRKTAVARVRLRPGGQGTITINGRPVTEFFPYEKQLKAAVSPLVAIGRRDEFDIRIRVTGGGITGQADACKLGIARALKRYDQSLETVLRDGGMLTRDSRMVERKKPGLHKARRGTQFSKR